MSQNEPLLPKAASDRYFVTTTRKWMDLPLSQLQHHKPPRSFHSVPSPLHMLYRLCGSRLCGPCAHLNCLPQTQLLPSCLTTQARHVRHQGFPDRQGHTSHSHTVYLLHVLWYYTKIAVSLRNQIRKQRFTAMLGQATLQWSYFALFLSGIVRSSGF